MEGLFTDFHSGFNSFKVDYVANRCNAAGIDFNPGTGNEALGKLDNYGNENAGTPSEEGTEQSRLSQIHKILALKDKNTGSYILQTKSMIEKNCSIGGATEDWVLLDPSGIRKLLPPGGAFKLKQMGRKGRPQREVRVGSECLLGQKYIESGRKELGRNEPRPGTAARA